MARERILITVKTYPTLSRKYGETVCTAGVRPDGSWLRIYPVPFRRLDEAEQYKKYDWLDCDLTRSRKDPRPETHHPVNVDQLVPVSHINTANNWRERRRLLLGKAKVYTSIQQLIDGAKANLLSLAVFKPAKIIGFIWEKEETPEWDEAKLAEMRDQSKQGELFEEEAWRKTFKVIPKLPYNFSYRFADVDGRESTLQVLDWETGMLFWNCRNHYGDDQTALEKVRDKYLNNFSKSDLHFFMGTTQQYHFVAPNPWVIVGVFPVPHEPQADLF